MDSFCWYTQQLHAHFTHREQTKNIWTTFRVYYTKRRGTKNEKPDLVIRSSSAQQRTVAYTHQRVFVYTHTHTHSDVYVNARVNTHSTLEEDADGEVAWPDSLVGSFVREYIYIYVYICSLEGCAFCAPPAEKMIPGGPNAVIATCHTHIEPAGAVAANRHHL